MTLIFVFRNSFSNLPIFNRIFTESSNTPLYYIIYHLIAKIHQYGCAAMFSSCDYITSHMTNVDHVIITSSYDCYIM